MLSNSQINEILSDICNFQLVVFGIAFSLFTLLYSFIMSKREQLIIYSDSLKKGDTSPDLPQKIKFSIDYINRLKRTNKYLIVLIIFSFTTYVFSWLSLRFIDCNYLKNKSFYILASISILTILYIILLICYVLFREYRKSSKL